MDAVRAAIEFQQAMSEVNSDQSDESRIMFRIGIHLGDLIVEGDDLYGDGVNIAARLERQAEPSGILVSGTVHESVSGRIKAEFQSLGSLSLKNIDRSITAYTVRWAADDWLVSSEVRPEATRPNLVPTLELPDKASIAVLPFKNMSGDPEQE